jgi:pyruvate,water dikinase
LAQYLEAYGERGLREAELTAPRFSENPEPVLEMIAGGLRLDPVDPDRRLMHARVLADREIAALEARLPYVERVLVRALVARARELTRLRERMRLWLGRTLGMLRTVVLDVDRRMRRLDPKLEADSAFYCTFDELVSAVGSSRADLAPIARLRRAAFERDAALPDPPETFQGAPPPLVLPPLGGVVLHGMGAAPGSVVGRARLIGPGASGASRLEAGDVIVVRALDLGLVPLFFLASGVVAELGGPLSHGAVAARECGLPLVVGVPGAMTSVTDGERLRLDGDRGVVERLDA